MGEGVVYGGGGNAIGWQRRCKRLEYELGDVFEEGGTVLKARGNHDQSVTTVRHKDRGLEAIECLEDERVNEGKVGGGGGKKRE